MAYTATLNDTAFFNTAVDSDEYKLTTAKVSIATSQAGFFSFTVPPQNIAYSNFHKLIDYVDVYQDNDIIFSGRVYSIQKIFNTQLIITCEGLIALFNDSISRPFTHDGSFADLIAALIDNHNAQVDSSKQITIGTIEIDDDETYRDYISYRSTLSRLQDLHDSYGGHFFVRRTANGLVFDWLESFSTRANQTIDFGVNEISNYQEESADNIITVLIPLGAEIFNEDDSSNEGARLTIESVNGGLDYIEADQSYIAEYGRIVGTYIWDDVNIPAILLSKGQQYLNSKLIPKVTITVDAVDLKDAGYNIDSFKEGQQIQVNSIPHEINGEWFDLVSRTIDLLDPTSKTIVLNTTRQGLISTQLRESYNSTTKIDRVISNYTTNEAIRTVQTYTNELGERIVENESLIEQNSDNISSLVTQIETMGENVSTLTSEYNQTAETIGLYFGENGKISTWFEFDADYFSIKKDGQSVYSRQDNDSYEFCDASNNTLMKMDTDGMTAPTANVSKQLRFLYENTPQWAIRKGVYIASQDGINLDDVWLG